VALDVGRVAVFLLVFLRVSISTGRVYAFATLALLLVRRDLVFEVRSPELIDVRGLRPEDLRILKTFQIR
jgi:hypothetical protein